MTLYRAADDTSIPSGSCSFATERRAARAYLAGRNPGFGGSTLYRLDIEIDAAAILDLTDGAPEWLRELHHDVGSVGLDELVTRPECRHVQAAILARGYRWVRVEESYPDDTITMVLLTAPGEWYGDDEIAPNMIAI